MSDRGLCLFGGAFDPPHRSHRRAVEAAVSQLDVGRVRVLPCRDHPHKGGAIVAGAEHRLAMCRLNFADLERVEVSDAELRRDGPSYTVETLRLVRAEVGHEVPLYFLIGADNVAALPTWHDHHGVLARATVVVVPRAGHPLSATALAELDLTPDERDSLLRHELRVEPDAVAATEIRGRLARGEPSPDLLSEVEEYARRHALYRAP